MRHAVVVIHGIGEQKPMDTLRNFVSSVTRGQGINREDIKYYSKPDNLSSLFELRRLTTASSEKDGRIKTDFYEYYWAYNIRGTRLQQVLSWIWQVIFRWPWTLPKRIRPFHIAIWMVILGALILTISGYKNTLSWKGPASMDRHGNYSNYGSTELSAYRLCWRCGPVHIGVTREYFRTSEDPERRHHLIEDAARSG